VVQDCPKCGLVNPPDAQRCDCGYDFASRTVQRSYLGENEAQALHSPSVVEVIVCVLVPVVGIFLGLRARGRGRRPAGNTMLLISGIVFAVWVGARVLLMIAT
jgi:hypothetical protein